jgi:hypothetical protein
VLAIAVALAACSHSTPPPAPSTQTVTVTAAPPTSASSPTSASPTATESASTDDAFLAKVHSKGIHSDNGDSGLVADAHWVCGEYAKGYGSIEVSYRIFSNHSDDKTPGFDLYQGSDPTSGTFLSGDNAGYFVYAAHDAYCPNAPGGTRQYP